MRIALASDHAALAARAELAAHLRSAGHEIMDLGCEQGERVDYPDYAMRVARVVGSHDATLGVLLCGTGIGMSIAANKVPGVRAALVHDVTTARLAAEHNRANILCLGVRVTGSRTRIECVDAWLSTPFDPRHQPRLDKIAALESARDRP